MGKLLLLLPNLDAGGAQRALLRIAAGEADRGHDVHLAIIDNQIEYAVPKGIKLHIISPRRRLVSGGWLGKRLAAARLRNWYRKANAEKPFDLIFVSLPFAHEIAKLAALPSVWYQVVNTLSAEIESLSRNSPRKAQRRLARYKRLYDGERVATVSHGVTHDLVETLEICPREAVTIYNPFDLEAMREATKALPADIPQEPYVLHVGRFAKQKRHDILLNAYVASQIPHRLVLITRNEDVSPLQALVNTHGLHDRVSVLDFRENVFPWYARASAFVLSSDFEGMPNVIVEALAAGTPVVSTDCPSGPREVLVGVLARYLAPCGDAEALGGKLRDIVQNPPTIDPAVLRPFSMERSLDMIESLATGRT
ncbi:MAG: Glycosyl transferase, group 1 [Pseudolabrys sp.]|jgi:glycosyltransferase involved in cell wall biosynthesis|nr:Glycosyl transferase, group 1 [Pseudolabrys sp.]